MNTANGIVVVYKHIEAQVAKLGGARALTIVVMEGSPSLLSIAATSAPRDEPVEAEPATAQPAEPEPAATEDKKTKRVMSDTSAAIVST